MALEIHRQSRADADLDEIWLYIAQDNMAAADRVIDRIEAAENRLAEFPQLGRSRPEVSPGVRSWTIGDYVLLYRITPSHLEVVRVVHGARDLGGLFDEASD